MKTGLEHTGVWLIFVKETNFKTNYREDLLLEEHWSIRKQF